MEQYSVVTVVKWQGDVAAVLYCNPGYMRVRDLLRGRLQRLSGPPSPKRTKVYPQAQDLSPSLGVSRAHEVPGQEPSIPDGAADREGQRGRVYSGFRWPASRNAVPDRDSSSHSHALHGKHTRHSDGEEV